MKILYIITKSNWGGAQRHVFDLAVKTKEKGYETVVALGGAGILNDRLMEAGVSTRSISGLGRDMSLGSDAASFSEILKIVKEVRPDVLHVHSPKAAGLGAVAGRLCGIKKIIYTVHGWAFNEDRPLHQKAAIAFFSWLTILFSTQTILLSEKELGQTEKFPFVSKKLTLIPLGIEAPLFYGQANARDFIEKFIKDKGLNNDTILSSKKVLVGTIAELHPNKGLVYAINAMERVVSKMPFVIFFIIGGGEQEKYLGSLITQKKLEKNVILAGYMANAVQYLKGFSIFLLPSVKEGLPYTIIEAGYAALPVISTTVGGIPEIIDDMKSGILLQPKKSDEIAHAIEFLVKHKKVQKEYGLMLQAKVKQKFNLAQMINITFKLYAKTSNKNQPRN